MERQPYQRSKPPPERTNALIESIERMRATGPFVCEDTIEGIEDRCFERLAQAHDPLLTDMLTAIRSLRQDNRKLTTALETKRSVSHAQLKAEVAAYATEFLLGLAIKLQDDPQPEQSS